MGTYLAIDLGASGGRHILGSVESGRISLREVHRFTNRQVRRNGHDCWDLELIEREIRSGFEKALTEGPIDSFGIDSWGVDFVLVDRDLSPLGDAVAYRDARTSGVPARVEGIIPFEELYARTGIAKAEYNTIYQLFALQEECPQLLAGAHRMMMIPEYLTSRLTGVECHEYTESSTTALADARRRGWDFELIRALGFPERLFGRLDEPGAPAGEYRGVKAVLPPMHDTACAFLSASSRGANAAILSSGTWSLLGTVGPEPIITAEARELGFTNEGGAYGKWRFLKNIMGLWMIQSIRRELNGEAYVAGKLDASAGAREAIGAAKGNDYSFAGLADAARAAGEPAATFDVDDPRFLNPDSMIAAVLEVLAEKGARAKSVGELMAAVYASLAGKYASAVKGLAAATGRSFDSLAIVGGGSRDGFLNELSHRATGLEVVAGPVEGTATGSVIAQAIAAGEFESVKEAGAAI